MIKMQRWNRPQRKKVKCPTCKCTKYKIRFTHGVKSRGYKVCKACGGIIK